MLATKIKTLGIWANTVFTKKYARSTNGGCAHPVEAGIDKALAVRMPVLVVRQSFLSKRVGNAGGTEFVMLKHRENGCLPYVKTCFFCPMFLYFITILKFKHL